MIVICLIFLVGFGVGYYATAWVPVTLRGQDRFLWALPLGLETLALGAFLGSWATGSVETAEFLVLAAALVFIGISVVFRRRRPGPLDVKGLGPILAILVPWVLFSLAVYPNLLVWKDGGITGGWVNAWADWSAHLRSSTFLAVQTPFTLENSLLTGVTARYPLLEDFLTSVVQRAGSDPVASLLWSGLPFFMLFPVILLSFFRALGLKPWFAALGSVLFVFSGGLGVLKLLFDLVSGVPWTVDAYHPRLYTDLRDASGNQTSSSIWFMNFVISEFIPQRAFLFGMPWALLTFLGFWQNFATKPTRRHRVTTALGLGTAWAALLLFHTHSAVALGVVFVTGAMVVLGREWAAKVRIRWVPGLIFGVTATGLGSAVFATFLMDFGKVGAMVHFIPGWLPGQADFFATLLFLVRNLGIILVTGLLSLGIKDLRTRIVAIGGLVLLLLANLLAFQPWTWDNMKLLTWWYLLAVAATVFGAQHLWKKWPKGQVRRLGAGLGAILLLLAAGAGAWDVAMMGATSVKPELGLASQDGIDFALGVQGYLRTHPDQSRSIVAIAPDHNHPVSLVSGARIFVGYTGWLWSYGLSYQDRIDRQKIIYAGGQGGLASAREAGIGYLVCGPPEKNTYNADPATLGKTFPPVLTYGPWTLLKVP